MRLFALERVRGVEVTRQRFEIPEGYRPEEHFRSAFGLVSDRPMKVKVRFSADVAHSVKERIWMPGQKLKADGEGGVTVEFEAAGEMELVSWILSYGAHAEVLEPPELRAEVKRQVRGMRQFYRTRDGKAGKRDKRHN
jgi:proteasome accessory factor B